MTIYADYACFELGFLEDKTPAKLFVPDKKWSELKTASVPS